jgi:hypothetical protein
MKKRFIVKEIFVTLLFAIICVSADSQNKNTCDSVLSALNAYNIDWDMPGPSSSQSMPLGNGDIGLNAWVEPGGDICFYISKTDAWGTAAEHETNNWQRDGGVLMKLGKIRITVSPNQLPAEVFHQVLKLSSGEILIEEGSNLRLKIWVDANHPVIRVEAKCKQTASFTIKFEDWRLNNGDTVLQGQNDKIIWCHQNPVYADVHLQKFIFGAAISGKGLTRKSDLALQANNVQSQLFSIYPLTTDGKTAAQWSAQLYKQIAAIDKLDYEKMRAAHVQWWNNFWKRSWVFVRGDDDAIKVTHGYILQRFVTACAGRGKYPIKFNGSIFVVDNPGYQADNNQQRRFIDADHREWGGQYWMQNTRPMYWPCLMAGDFDMMRPFFSMYKNMMRYNQSFIRKYYHHEGVYFAETTPFWGGLPYVGPEVKENYTAHYFTPVLELSMMMLDYYQYTGNKKFALDTLVPVASAGIDFFDKHFLRDTAGKLLLDPDNSIEMYWKVHNPAPDIAGLNAVLKRLLALPADITDAALIAKWQRLYNDLPPLPLSENENKQVLLPYTGPQTAEAHNFENPELYAVYPYRLYGLGKPDLQVAINTFDARKNREKGCWVQDPIQAAMLGLTDVAKTYLIFNFTRTQSGLKFPAFWATGHDYAPDEDNGGNGEQALQQMLMQVDNKKIMLLPAWPAGWDADFKLNAPYNTTVKGKVRNGRLTDVVITPASRKADLIDMSLQR